MPVWFSDCVPGYVYQLDLWNQSIPFLNALICSDQVTDNKLAKVSKVNLPPLYCFGLFKLCQRVNIKLKFSTCTSEYSFELGNADGVTLILSFVKAFYAYFKEYFV